MDKRKSHTKGQKIDVLHANSGLCHWCEKTINPAREDFEIEHVIALAAGGTDEVSNKRPIHIDCHKEKTRGDRKVIAKVKRVKAKAEGTFRPPRSVVAGSRSHWLKKKLNGEVVVRATGKPLKDGWSR